jgi:SAM-dependent methyltransferase
MQSFSQRSDELELMDQENIDFEEFHHCLQQLETINQLTFAYRPTLKWLRKNISNEDPMVILDVACGGGDMLRQIETKLSPTLSKPPRLVGVDLNPHAKQSALRVSKNSAIQYQTADVFSFQYETPVDLIICSLFTHHLDDAQIIQFLQWLNLTAQRGWFISDLHRHPIPYYFIKFATKLGSRNRLIRNDAAVSVARAFTRKDWQRLLDKAEINGHVEIAWYFPFRIGVSCEKS